MPASSFPAYVTQNIGDGTQVFEYPVSAVAGETLTVGELAFYDTTDDRLERCGADPALIAGISEVDSTVASTITPDGKIPLRVLSSRAVVAMASATVYDAATHIGVEYGVVRNGSGYWLVDTSDTSNVRVIVVGGDTVTNTFYVKFLAANLQFDAVAS